MTLKAVIEKHIEGSGPISFEKFMDMALYFPGMGYYSRHDTRIGKDGDFYTSPHLHPVFGAVMARQIEQMWEVLDKPAGFTVIEPGPGAGYLCLDILNHLAKKQSPLLKRLQYQLLEINPSLKQQQQERLRDYDALVSWPDSLEPFDYGCVLAHEVLDAFPVRRVVNTKTGGLNEVYVTVEHGELRETLNEAEPELADYFTSRNVVLPIDYSTEVNLRLKAWLNEVSRVIAKEGFVMIIDYGHTQDEYFSRERHEGTLLCYYRHRVSEDFYNNIGLQDMTAHVNFTDLHIWAAQCGLKTIGFCPQVSFLLGLGIDELIMEFCHTKHDIDKGLGQIKGLIFDTGQSHQVMVQYKGKKNPLLRGFSVRNRLGAL